MNSSRIDYTLYFVQIFSVVLVVNKMFLNSALKLLGAKSNVVFAYWTWKESPLKLRVWMMVDG